MEFQIPQGITQQVEVQVTTENTAIAFGSGSIRVFATPAMVALMEKAALQAAERYLPQGYTTVGIKVDVEHLAATPIGMNVTATAELLKIEGKKLTFKVMASDENEKIGEGKHERFIVEIVKFLAKAENKGARN